MVRRNPTTTAGTPRVVAGPRALRWLAAGATLAFAIPACSTVDQTAPEPVLPSSIVITAETTGSNLDPDGYTVSLDEMTNRPIAINGTTTFSNVVASGYQIQLIDVAANCQVTSPNPLGLSVVAGEVGDGTFTVVCS